MKTSLQKIGVKISAALLAGMMLVNAPMCVYASESSDSAASEEGVVAADPSVVVTNAIGGWPQAADTYSQAACLLDVNTGTFLYNKHMDEQMYPASTTKVMTALMALEFGNLSDVVTMTEEGVAYARMYDSSNLATSVGEEFTLEQLLYGTLIYSANDMATQIGVYLCGSIEEFSKLMNTRAMELGCTNTHFNNACGMPDPDHWTTAHDLALIFREALKYDTFRTIINTHSYTIPATNMSGARDITSHNALLVDKRYKYDGIIGGKTGYTDAAGSCLVTGAERDGRVLIAVTLKAKDGGQFAEDHTMLLDYGYEQFNLVDLPYKDQAEAGGSVLVPSDSTLEEMTMLEEDVSDEFPGCVRRNYYIGDVPTGSVIVSKEVLEESAKTAAEEVARSEKSIGDWLSNLTGNDKEEDPEVEQSGQNSTGAFEKIVNYIFSHPLYAVIILLGVLIVIGLIIIIAILLKSNGSETGGDDYEEDDDYEPDEGGYEDDGDLVEEESEARPAVFVKEPDDSYEDEVVTGPEDEEYEWFEDLDDEEYYGEEDEDSPEDAVEAPEESEAAEESEAPEGSEAAEEFEAPEESEVPEASEAAEALDEEVPEAVRDKTE